MLSLPQMRLSFMMKICTLFLLLGFASCTIRQATETPAVKVPVRQSSMQVYKTTRSNISFTVADWNSGELLFGAAIVIKDSLGVFQSGKTTDINGQSFFTEPAVFPSHGSIDFRFAEHVPLRITNACPQHGDSIVIRLVELDYKDTLIIDYFPPSINDPFSPQNKTIDRKEIRRMPK